MNNPFWGKYRGTVIDNEDPLMLGRLQVTVPAVPAVLGEVLTAWAMPCVPYAGPQVGFYMMPPIDAGCWVEFEGGDPDYPIWVGCYWREGELPPVIAGLPTMRIIQTGSGLLRFDDLPGEGGFALHAHDPAVDVPIAIDACGTGLTITVGDVRVSVDAIGVTVVADPARLSLTTDGVSIAHGAAEIDMVDPAVTIAGQQ